MCLRRWANADSTVVMRLNSLANPTAGRRFVIRTTRLTITLLITAMGCGGILLAQRGLFALLDGNIATFGTPLLAGASALCAAFRDGKINHLL